MSYKKILMLGACVVVMSTTQANAQLNNEASPNPIEGVTITSNNDNSASEQLTLSDSGEDVFVGNGQTETLVQNSNDVRINYDAGNNGSGSFALTTGGASVLTANNAGNITIQNAMTTNAVDNTGTFTTAGGTANVNASSNFNTNINTGTSTGTVAIGNAASTTTVLGTANINATGAAATNVGTGTGAVTVGNTTGAAAVNGSTVTSTAATTNSMVSGDNSVVVNNTANTVTLTADSDATAGNGRSVITAGPTSASVSVTTATGQSHGLNVGQTSTTLSGGTTSTTLTLDDSGATFADTTTGGPARVMGVADGVNDFDAVNMRQFNGLVDDMEETQGGVASVAAMSNIPQVGAGQNFSLGLGYGNFAGESAIAAGGSARITDNLVAKTSLGFGAGKATFGGGVAYAW